MSKNESTAHNTGTMSFFIQNDLRHLALISSLLGLVINLGSGQNLSNRFTVNASDLPSTVGTIRSTTLSDPCLLLEEFASYTDEDLTPGLSCRLSKRDGGYLVRIHEKDMPETLRTMFVDKKIQSSKDYLHAKGATIVRDDEGLSLKFQPKNDYLRSNNSDSAAVWVDQSSEIDQYLQNNSGGRNTNQCTPRSRNRITLVIAAEFTDQKTSTSDEVLSKRVFGTNEGDVTLKSQMDACSNGKVNIIPATESTTGERITDGVYRVYLNEPIQNKSRYDTFSAMHQEAERELGNLWDQYDHVMFCMPPGSQGNWLAFGYYNSPFSAFNDQLCTSVSHQMHEVGHNFNLRHSNEFGCTGNDLECNYEDKSGYVSSLLIQLHLSPFSLVTIGSETKHTYLFCVDGIFLLSQR